MNSLSLNAVVTRVSLVDSVYETLVEAIVSGQLPAGTDLNSVVLAEQLDVSRTPVKEALKLLARDGLVHQVNNHRARVTELSPDDVREIYEVRSCLEAAAAERAATRISPDVLGTLRREAAQLRRRRKEVGWIASALEFDVRLHRAIADAAGNKRLRDEIEQYRLLVRSFCRITGQQATVEQALDEHIAVLDALATGRAALARKAMATHIQSRLNAVLAQMASED